MKYIYKTLVQKSWEDFQGHLTVYHKLLVYRSVSFIYEFKKV